MNMKQANNKFCSFCLSVCLSVRVCIRALLEKAINLKFRAKNGYYLSKYWSLCL